MITNNMMYRHDITLYDAETREVVHKLSDTIDAEEFGLDHLSGRVSGAPVEAVWTADGQYAYVSQYQVTDHRATAEDNCSNGSAITPSLVYRYSVEEKDWDQVIPVGRVPKYVALSPDGTAMFVMNYDQNTVSKFDAATLEELDRQPTGHLPIGVTYHAQGGEVWGANYSGSLSIYDDTDRASSALD